MANASGITVVMMEYQGEWVDLSNDADTLQSLVVNIPEVEELAASDFAAAMRYVVLSI